MQRYDNDVLTVSQVAEMLQIHPITARKYVREGKIKAKKMGRQWRVTRSAVYDYLQNYDN